MTETRRLALVAKVTDKIGREGKDVKSTFSTLLLMTRLWYQLQQVRLSVNLLIEL